MKNLMSETVMDEHLATSESAPEHHEEMPTG